MAFQKYKSIAQVQEEYAIRLKEENFIPGNAFVANPVFLQELNFNIYNLDAFSSEAARCELVILPILREVYKTYVNGLSLWIQKSIRYDKRLNGTPDYMVSKRSQLGKNILEYPVVMVVEAKKNDFEQGWGQCLAELVAAQKLNVESNRVVYGVVTDGKYWEFGKLEQQRFSRNQDSFPITQIEMVMGAVDFIFSESQLNLK